MNSRIVKLPLYAVGACVNRRSEMHTVGEILSLGTAGLQLAAAVFGVCAARRAHRRRRATPDHLDAGDSGN